MSDRASRCHVLNPTFSGKAVGRLEVEPIHVRAPWPPWWKPAKLLRDELINRLAEMDGSNVWDVLSGFLFRRRVREA